MKLEKENGKERCNERREMRWKEEMRERKPEEKGAMIKEKWKGKVQLEKGNGKERCNERMEMGRKGAIRERKWEGKMQ